MALVLTTFTASSGPRAFTTLAERLLRVAEGALVVRVVRRPHHPVDADALDQLEPERVDHERGVHVVLPVVGDVLLDRVVGHVLERGVEVLAVLQRGRHPVDAALEPADGEAGVPVEDAAEHVAPEHLAERRHVVHHADEHAVVGARRPER